MSQDNHTEDQKRQGTMKQGQDLKIITRKAPGPNQPEGRYKPLEPSQTLLKTGYQHLKGSRPLPCDVIFERDVAVKLRDGVTIYIDIYRPADPSVSVPALLNWAPYGKGQTGVWDLDNSDMFPFRFGVSRGAVSGLQCWEGADPAYWVNHGYAVVQADARGVFNSEGDIIYNGAREGRDEHDLIEHLASCPWCNGRVGLCGNSWLSMSQWHTAATHPAHLAAIAPWEGLTDLYREVVCRGGIPDTAFAVAILNTLFGFNEVEDIEAMLEAHPLFDGYWAEKVPDLSTVKVPAYVVASYSNRLHASGTIKGWEALAGEKWLRIHNSQEWPDFYNPENQDDLRRFFDRYLKGIENGWEETPRVRMAVLDPGGTDTVNRPVPSFPPPGGQGRTFYLDAQSSKLVEKEPQAVGRAMNDLTTGSTPLYFLFTFTEDVEIIGYPSLSLWVSQEGHDDMDLYFCLEKLNRRGKRVRHQAVDFGLPLSRKWMPFLSNRGVKTFEPAFFPGANAMLRVSRRMLDETASTPERPYHAFTTEQKLADNEIVRIDVPFWPIAMRWRKDEILRLRISALTPTAPELPGLPEPTLQPGKRHYIHTGPDHPSQLRLQVYPASR